MAIKVGRWDCKQCGHKGNKGPTTHCEKCGAPRPKNVKFYLTSDAEIVTDEDEKRKARAGADWVCSFCGAHNKINVSNCFSCGNDRDAQDGDKSLQQKLYAQHEIPIDSSETPEVQTSQKKPFRIGKLIRNIILILFGFLILFGILTSIDSEIEVMVEQLHWERTLEIEEYKQVQEDGWSLPEGAILVESFNDVHHYNQVFDGYETKTRTVREQTGTEQVVVGTKDLGNGYFEEVYEERPVYEEVEETYQEERYRDEPVYQTKYRYLIYRWVEVDPIKTEGNNQQTRWPESERIATGACRVTDSIEKYSITIVDHKGEKHEEEVPYKFWRNTQINAKIKALKSAIFNYYKGIESDE